MDLVTIEELLLVNSIRDHTDPGVRERYDRLRLMAEQSVKSFCKWNIEIGTVTRYLAGNNQNLLPLPDPFVSTITLCNIDQGGYYGQGTNAFPLSGSLTLGRDYALVKQGDYAKSGLLQMIGGQSQWWWWPSDMVFLGQRRSGLSYVGPPVWPGGQGNIKVSYIYGFTQATMPEDIKLAVCNFVQIIGNTTRYGGPIVSENLGDYSYSLASANQQGTEFGSIRQALNPYRLLAIGSTVGL